tara:strand:- start:87 stop:485 length:399 start_codon:yes stop_codon:yes gene_type:complete
VFHTTVHRTGVRNNLPASSAFNIADEPNTAAIFFKCWVIQASFLSGSGRALIIHAKFLRVFPFKFNILLIIRLSACLSLSSGLLADDECRFYCNETTWLFALANINYSYFSFSILQFLSSSAGLENISNIAS